MPDAIPPTRADSLRNALGYGALAIGTAVVFVSIGQGGTLGERMIAVIRTLAMSGWTPMVYLLGSYGFGTALIRSQQWPDSTRWMIRLCVGLVLSLSLSHGLGVLGLLGPMSAWMVSGIGCLLAINQLRKLRPLTKPSLIGYSFSIPNGCFVVGAALIIIMSCNPPGVSWDSEFNGFDELSYHLELPRQWMEQERIWPSEQSVYSYLPSYVESAYVHLTALTGTIETGDDGMSAFWFHNGRAAMTTHLFSAMLSILSALAMGSLIRRLIELHLPETNEHRSLIAGAGRAMMMCLPWVAAVGSIAYNEMAVVLLAIGALAVVIEQGISAPKRSMIAGVLVAGACCAKPTAIFLVAPSIGIVLLAPIPFKQWFKPILGGCVVGLIVLLPWLVRNEVASGNPVFPHAASVFGMGHWDAQQHGIFQLAHHFDGTMLDRFKFIAMPDDRGSHHVSRFRGLSNLQWGLVPIVGLIGCVVLVAKPKSRRIGFVAVGSIVLPMLGWMFLTHLQSRFLIPLAPVFIGVGIFGIASLSTRWILKPILIAITLISSAWLFMIASMQSSGNPSLLIDLGPTVFISPGEIAEPAWSAVVNDLAEPGEQIYLFGDATPVYVRSPMIANTVYDRWLIQDAIESNPDTPGAWTQTLLDQQVDILVVCFSEIQRYGQSGWLPDSILESLEHRTMRDWITSLGQPIYTWTHPTMGHPIRSMYRISTPLPSD